MKNLLKIRRFFLIVISIFLITSSFAQKAKKNKVRLKAQYVKIMDGEIYLDISATSKIKKQHIKVSNIELTVFNEVNDEKTKVGKITTNTKGKCKFKFKNLNSIQPDSTSTYNLLISFKGNETFKKAKKSIRFKDATINAKLITKDSINYITATLIDPKTNSPIVGESLNVQVQRLFNPLQIGKEFNNTDDDGTIIVPIEEGIPGINGNLTIEVVLNDSDDFGTIKTIINAPIGNPIIDESTFNQRTMWSPRNKTPLFLLIFPNLLIFGVWGLILYLIANLFKINKN